MTGWLSCSPGLVVICMGGYGTVHCCISLSTIALCGSGKLTAEKENELVPFVLVYGANCECYCDLGDSLAKCFGGTQPTLGLDGLNTPSYGQLQGISLEGRMNKQHNSALDRKRSQLGLRKRNIEHSPTLFL